MLVSDPDASRLRLIRDASFLAADRREIALWRCRHNRLGFAHQVAFVRGLGRWKNVILYGEIKIDPTTLNIRAPWRVFQRESGQSGPRPRRIIHEETQPFTAPEPGH